MPFARLCTAIMAALRPKPQPRRRGRCFVVARGRDSLRTSQSPSPAVQSTLPVVAEHDVETPRGASNGEAFGFPPDTKAGSRSGDSPQAPPLPHLRLAALRSPPPSQSNATDRSSPLATLADIASAAAASSASMPPPPPPPSTSRPAAPAVSALPAAECPQPDDDDDMGRGDACGSSRPAAKSLGRAPSFTAPPRRRLGCHRRVQSAAARVTVASCGGPPPGALLIVQGHGLLPPAQSPLTQAPTAAADPASEADEDTVTDASML